MSRKPLAIGQHGSISLQAIRDGKPMPKGDRRKPDSWVARARYRDASGRRREVRGYGRTMPLAEQDAKDKVRQKSWGASAIWSPDTPLPEAVRDWLGRLDRAESTKGVYTQTAKRCIQHDSSPFAGLTLQTANDPQVLRVALQKVADGHGMGSMRHTRVILRGIYADATAWRVIERASINDVGRITQGKPVQGLREPGRAMTPAEVTKALGVAHRKVTEAKTWRKENMALSVERLMILLWNTGMRIGEALALEWQHVHLDEARLLVTKGKTDSARRWVPMSASLVAHLLQVPEDKREGLVCPAPQASNATPWAPWDKTNATRALKRVLVEAGLPWATSHTARATVLTHLLNSGHAPNRVAGMAGHSDPSVTLKSYADPAALQPDKADLAEALSW